jgi:hypothetical protein
MRRWRRRAVAPGEWLPGADVAGRAVESVAELGRGAGWAVDGEAWLLDPVGVVAHVGHPARTELTATAAAFLAEKHSHPFPTRIKTGLQAGFKWPEWTVSPPAAPPVHHQQCFWRHRRQRRPRNHAGFGYPRAVEDYTNKYKGEQVELALFGGEYQEGTLTAYCSIEDVPHVELNGHILVPLQNVASLHCSSRCDAPQPDWPPRGLEELDREDDRPDDEDDES